MNFMEYKIRERAYELISPGTISISQKISSSDESGEETSKLVFLAKNEVIPCSHNQY